MNRPRVIWMALVVCGLLIVGAMAWLTARLLGMETERALAEANAEVEERVRLALSRMDTAGSGLLVIENQRPPEHFQAFFSPGDLFTNTFQSVTDGLVLQASPLLSEPPEFVRLHFEVNAKRILSSPQVPTGNQRDLAEVAGVTVEELDMAAARLRALESLLSESGPEGQAEWSKGTNLDRVLFACAPNVSAWNELQVDVIEERTNWMANQRQMVGNQMRQQEGYQQELSIVDQGQRAMVYENTLNKAAQSSVKRAGKSRSQEKQARGGVAQDGAADPSVAPVKPMLGSDSGNRLAPADGEQPEDAGQPPVSLMGERVVTPFRPVWLGEELFALRHVRSRYGSRYQGVWLDAAELKSNLLASVGDQLPHGSLLKVDALVNHSSERRPDDSADSPPASSLDGVFGAGRTPPDSDPRALVTLPWRLDDGERIGMLRLGWTAQRGALGIGWVAVGFSLLAAAVLLGGVMRMSERRAAFVSSVTHELRTPLTTFQLYSDMLAEGMVRDEKVKQGYLDTLRLEAGRLNHLIENVLAYSRIERGSARAQRERVTLPALIARIEGRLVDRADQEAAKIVVIGTKDCEDSFIDTDVTAVEQIVFNLVDNACKYGLPEDGDRVVRLSVAIGIRTARIEVCDDGGGIARRDAKKLFRPFHKSAKDAAHSKPGVGLGLALCKRLACALGGDLTIDLGRKRGACFVLELPRA